MNKSAARILVLIILVSTGCRTLKNDVLLEPDHTHRIFKLKILARGPDFKQRGKIIWKFDKHNHSRMVFLTPLNQIIFLMYVNPEEEAVLLSLKKRLYWRGDFSALLERMWGIGFLFTELKDLVYSGVFPRVKKAQYQIRIEIERQGKGNIPYRIKIYRKDLLINMKIFSRAIKVGRINPALKLDKCRESTLEEILESFG